MANVLLVEDSEECQVVVKRALANAELNLTTAATRQEAKDLAKKMNSDFDIVILDLALPDGDGFEVWDDLRLSGLAAETPVFFLTSTPELNSKITAFNMGADDYLVKPVSPIELRARVEMRLRKAKNQIAEKITKGQLLIEMTVLRASRMQGKNVVDLALTAKEFKILSFLIQNEGQVFSRSQIVAAVWGKDIHILDRTVDSHIYGLRKKMGSIGHYVECIPQAGYRFNLQAPMES